MRSRKFKGEALEEEVGSVAIIAIKMGILSTNVHYPGCLGVPSVE